MAVNRKAIEALLMSGFDKMNPGAALREAITEKTPEIVEINKQQLDRGLKATGESLGKYARYSYKKRFQPVDLKLYGDFRAKFSIEVRKNESEIFSQDWKNDILTHRRWGYGPDIFGIPTPMIDNVGELLRFDFFYSVREQLKLSNHA